MPFLTRVWFVLNLNKLSDKFIHVYKHLISLPQIFYNRFLVQKINNLVSTIYNIYRNRQKILVVRNEHCHGFQKASKHVKFIVT